MLTNKKEKNIRHKGRMNVRGEATDFICIF